MPTNEEILDFVRKHYSSVANEQRSCCGGESPSTTAVALQLGYAEETLQDIPADANLGLGCGNPLAIAGLKQGDTALDLGSGTGFDCFLAAKQVGEAGSVIGVDMTPEMIAKARDNAKKVDLRNVQFRLGEIEHLPVADNSVDVIISNCVINLSPNKPQVFKEAYRVLKPGGRLAVSDIVLRAALSDEQRVALAQYYAQCVSGASTIDELGRTLTECGFVDVRIQPKESSKEFIKEWSSEVDLEEFIVSATIEARKP